MLLLSEGLHEVALQMWVCVQVEEYRVDAGHCLVLSLIALVCQEILKPRMAEMGAL
jgi:hypothetical protein